MFKMKKLSSMALAVVMTLSMGTNAFAATSNNEFTSMDEFKEHSLEVEAAVEYLDQFVVVVTNENGSNEFMLKLPSSARSMVGTEILTLAQERIEDVNIRSTNGEIEITDSGKILNPDDSTSNQRANIDKFEEYWWGYTRWASRGNAYNIQDGMSKISTGAWGVASIGGLICMTPAAAAGVGAVIGGVYSGVMYGWMATDIGATLRNNPNDGIKLSLYLSCAYSVKPQ